MAFLENQMASALTLQSAQEYRYWLLIYARFLVNEGDQDLLLSFVLYSDLPVQRHHEVTCSNDA